MKAFCYASGQIHFGNILPDGAIPIASGPASRLKRVVGVLARWSYPSKPGAGDSVPLVPGIPEAEDQTLGLAALMQFRKKVGVGMAEPKPPRRQMLSNSSISRKKVLRANLKP